MRIKKTFLKLTRMTYPRGYETYLEHLLPENYQKDQHGNYFISIGNDYSTMFTCHLDTACKAHQFVKHTFSKNFVGTDGNTILGADDKAGMVVLLYMIEHKVPGLYYFFIGEEVGCVGSSDLSISMAYDIKENIPNELKNIKKVVSFDRRGTTSVITEQFYGRCCSDEFAEALSKSLNDSGFGLQMKPDDTGILTDSAQFIDIVPECTNISVGYYNEHCFTEKQDIDFLYRLCRSVVKVDWEALPISRDPSIKKTRMDEYDRYLLDGNFGEDVFESGFKLNGKDNHYNSDDYKEYSESFHTIILENGRLTKMYISQTWINNEKLLITNLLNKQGRLITDMRWDGTCCYVIDAGSKIYSYVGTRSMIAEFIPNFGLIPKSHLRPALYIDMFGNFDNSFRNFSLT